MLEPTIKGPDAVRRLQASMMQFPQAELETKHFFAGGMYCRWLWRPKDCLIVGKVHLKEHFYFVVSGKVLVTTDAGVRMIEGPELVVSSPGTKRAVLALEDSLCVTFHKLETETEDLDLIESELIEPDDTALFDSNNRPRISV